MRASSTVAGRTLNVLVKAAFANALPDDLLSDAITIDRAKALFSQYVDQVEIENHSFCNRVCWFCPNAFIDRRSVSHEMPEHVFETIMGGLREIDYAGALTWSRFHEALASPRIFERLGAARAALPRAGLVMISNGDYLNRKTLPRLDELGLDRLIIDLYMPDGRERDPKAISSGLRKFSRRTGMALEPTGGIHLPGDRTQDEGNRGHPPSTPSRTSPPEAAWWRWKSFPATGDGRSAWLRFGTS